MRILVAVGMAGLATLLTACGGEARAGAEGGTPADPHPSSDGTMTIACAIGGAKAFDSTCSVERTEIDGVRLLTVFQPDGGFRRFEQLADGSGLAAVAGADAVTQTLKGDTLEIAIAANRYRFPVSPE